MADREPRRRKKRKDSTKKEDHHIEDSPPMMFHKFEHKDLDHDADEDIVVSPSHQPSKLAQIVFTILFFALAGVMSSIFISLHGSSNHLDMFVGEDDHHSETEPPLLDTNIEHAESHEEEELIDLFPDLMKQFQAVVGGEGVDENISDKEKETVISDKIAISDFVEKSSIVSKNDIETMSDIFSTPDIIEESNNIEIGGIKSENDGGVEELIAPIDGHISVDEKVKEEILAQSEILDNNLMKDEQVEDKVPEEPQSDSIIHSSKGDDVTNSKDVKTEPISTESKSVTSGNTPNTSAVESNVEHVETVEINEDNKMEAVEVEYEHAEITNENDYDIKDQLDEIEKIIEKSPDIALKKYEAILNVNASSPRALYGKARALDIQADTLRSNKILEDAIAIYQKVLHFDNVPDKLYLLAGIRCVERMQFRGFIGKSIKLLLEMSSKYPKNIEIKNKIALGYLLIGRNKEAKKAFKETLKESPNNGFAKVHLGFILKTDDNDYENAIQLMMDGINSREPGVIDGRFYLHLGDALARTGKVTEAKKIYEDGVKEGLLLSVYQRSLYNVNGLTGKPWWDPSAITYAPYFKMLEKNWAAIKGEALVLINKGISNFAPETEGLQDKGDWKQFEMFARDNRNSAFSCFAFLILSNGMFS